jgi:hypothetical protein
VFPARQKRFTLFGVMGKRNVNRTARDTVVAFRVAESTAARIKRAAARDARRPSAFLNFLVLRALTREEQNAPASDPAEASV